jgi:hypothetical protein
MSLKFDKHGVEFEQMTGQPSFVAVRVVHVSTAALSGSGVGAVCKFETSNLSLPVQLLMLLVVGLL